MKAHKITLFIFSILAMMAILSWIWPQEGVSVFGTTINWPSLDEVLEVASTHNNDAEGETAVVELSAEELLAQQMEAAYQDKENAFLQFAQTSSIRLYMPNDSIGYLDNLFRALDNAKKKHVRIMHYGDSQLEEDRITSKLRTNLQEQFGGYGVGLLPAMCMTIKMTVTEKTRPELKYNLMYGIKRYRADDNRYGPLLQVCHVQGKATVEITPCKYTNYSHSRRFERIGVLAEGEGSIEIATSDSTYLLTADTISEMQQLFIDLPKPVTELNYVFHGNWRVYGLLLDGKHGVTVDNIPMRGYAGNTFNLIDKSTMRPFFNHQNVELIILQFGGNAVPGLRGEKNIASWKESIGKQIDYFRKLAPEACILMIGPADMSTTINGNLQTYPQLPKIDKALRETANEHGAAFWSMYDAMGGWNSMLRWVDARPQLAGEDYIHFTHKGADKMADLLNEVIQNYYKNYRLRYRLDPIDDEPKETVADTLSTKRAVSKPKRAKR